MTFVISGWRIKGTSKNAAPVRGRRSRTKGAEGQCLTMSKLMIRTGTPISLMISRIRDRAAAFVGAAVRNARFVLPRRSWANGMTTAVATYWA